MKPLASGRASEIFDLGDGRILRRFEAGGNPEREPEWRLRDPNVTERERRAVRRLIARG